MPQAQDPTAVYQSAWRPPPPVGPLRYGKPPARASLAAALAVLGLGLAAVSLVGLPIQHRSKFRGGNLSFLQIRDLADIFADRGSPRLFDAFSSFWWRYGLLIATGVLVVLVGVLVARPIGRLIGLAVALVAVAIGAAHAVALDRSPDYLSTAQFLRPKGTLYDHAGIGTWLGFSGLALVALAGLLVPPARRKP